MSKIIYVIENKEKHLTTERSLSRTTPPDSRTLTQHLWQVRAIDQRFIAVRVAFILAVRVALKLFM